MQSLDRGGQEHQDRGATLLADGRLAEALERFRLGGVHLAEYVTFGGVGLESVVVIHGSSPTTQSASGSVR